MAEGGGEIASFLAVLNLWMRGGIETYRQVCLRGYGLGSSKTKPTIRVQVSNPAASTLYAISAEMPMTMSLPLVRIIGFDSRVAK